MEASVVQVLTALAEILKALAWPSVAILVLFRFAPELRNLINRLREGAGAKFDPTPQGQANLTPILPSSTGSSALVPFLKTPALDTWEQTIKNMPLLKAVNDPGQREDILVNVFARFTLNYQFEIADSNMWASQLALVSYLLAHPQGESAENLQRLFYEPAQARFPEMFANYPFDSYLGFLQRSGLVSRSKDHVSITPTGTEFLEWRVAANRPPRLHG
jgi:hypothetical protein